MLQRTELYRVQITVHPSSDAVRTSSSRWMQIQQKNVPASHKGREHGFAIDEIALSI